MRQNGNGVPEVEARQDAAVLPERNEALRDDSAVELTLLSSVAVLEPRA